MQTKAIEHQATAGVEALAGEAELIEAREKYAMLQDKIENLLGKFDFLESDWEDIREGLNKVEQMVCTLELDSHYRDVTYISDNIKRVQQGLSNLRDIVEQVQD